MREKLIKSSVIDESLLQDFKKMATGQPNLSDTTFDEIYMLQKGKEKFIIGQKKATDRVENECMDSHLESHSVYFIAPLQNGKLQPATTILAHSNEKYDWDAGKDWRGTRHANTTISISKNNQQIYNISTQQYNSLDNFDIIEKAISEKKKISDQWRFEKSLPGKVTKLTRDTAQKTSDKAKKFKQKSLKSKFLIAGAALTPVALTAVAPEAVLGSTFGAALFASAVAVTAGAIVTGNATVYAIEKLCEKIKSFAKDIKEQSLKTVVERKIQDTKKRLKNKQSEKRKEKKLSHTEALAWLAIAEPVQTKKNNLNIIHSQREL